MPHFYLVADCRVDRLLELRREVNEASPVRISVNDFVLKAVAGALREVPAANAIWGDDRIRRHHASTSRSRSRSTAGSSRRCCAAPTG